MIAKTANSPIPNPNRHTLLMVAGLAALAVLSACSTVSVPTGEGAGVSSSATATLAGLRATAGLGPLTPDTQLEQAALQQAGYMASRERMSHTTGWGKDFASRMKDNGVRGAAPRTSPKAASTSKNCSTSGCIRRATGATYSMRISAASGSPMSATDVTPTCAIGRWFSAGSVTHFWAACIFLFDACRYPKTATHFWATCITSSSP